MTEPKKGLIETISDQNLRVVAEESKVTNELLTRLADRFGGNPDADYATINRTGTGLAGYTARIGRLQGEGLEDWFKRIQEMRDKLDVLQARVTRGEALASVASNRRKWGKAAQDRDREDALDEARRDGITVSDGE